MTLGKIFFSVFFKKNEYLPSSYFAFRGNEKLQLTYRFWVSCLDCHTKDFLLFLCGTVEPEVDCFFIEDLKFLKKV